MRSKEVQNSIKEDEKKTARCNVDSYEISNVNFTTGKGLRCFHDDQELASALAGHVHKLGKRQPIEVKDQ